MVVLVIDHVAMYSESAANLAVRLKALPTPGGQHDLLFEPLSPSSRPT